MMKHKYVRMVIGVFLGVWLLMSLCAMGGMYRLWWQREKRLYLGKDIKQQRIAVFKRAGFSGNLVEIIEKIRRQMPLDASYEASGDRNIISYVSYLLIPRVPAKRSDFKIEVNAGAIKYHGPVNRAASWLEYKETTGYKGLLFSFILVAGIAMLIRKSLSYMALSWPESFGLSFVVVMTLALFSIVLFESAHTGFQIATGIGVVGLACSIISWIKKRDLWSVDIVKKHLIRFLSCLFHGKKLHRLLMMVVGLIVVLSIFWSFLMSVVVVPDDWDAWAIWGPKAKILALGDGPLKDVTKFGHSDYPLLWPSIWAFSGWCAGGWEEQWSKGWGTVFLVLSAWELFLLIQRRARSKKAGILTAGFFLSVPMVPLLASWSYAEAPLWLMMLCALSSLVRWQESGNKFDVVLAGLFCAAAAYTKNEGVLFAVLIGFWFGAISGRRVVSVVLFLSVFLFCYGPWVYWTRFVLDFSSHAVTGLNLSGYSIKRALTRLPSAVQAIGSIWLDIRQWSVVGWGLGMSWVYLIFSPLTRNRLVLFFPILMLLGFLIVVLFHTIDIILLVNQSWNRLSIQILLLCFFAIMPEIWRRWNFYQKI